MNPVLTGARRWDNEEPRVGGAVLVDGGSEDSESILRWFLRVCMMWLYDIYTVFWLHVWASLGFDQ